MSKPKPKPRRKRPDPKAALYRAGHILRLADYEYFREYYHDRREARRAK